jgi:peptide/nickel transport system substrate-binding protein
VLIASMLKDVGIETDLKGYTTSLLYGPPGAGIQADGKFDSSLQTWYAGSDPDDSTQLTCDQVAPKGFNWTRYCSAAMDAAQRDALRSPDERTRKRAYARIEALLLRDVPIAFLASPVAISALRDDLGGFSPTLVTQAANAQRWTLHP